MKEYINICKLDKTTYKGLNPNITTDEVIITYKQIEHIIEQRQSVYNKYKDKLKEIIINPDYIIEDTKHINTGLVIKKYDKNV